MGKSDKMRYKIFTTFFIIGFLFVAKPTFGQQRKPLNQADRAITVITEPEAKVWIDGVLRGKTDETGKLVVKPVKAGTRKIRVRADGFKEVNKSLRPTRKGDLKIVLAKTSSQSELAFQQAEKVLSEDKDKAIGLYEKAIRLRPRYISARIGLARALTSIGNHEEALKMIAKARRIRRVFPEASAVEGRIYMSMSDYDKAIASFDRAIKEGRGFQPEAHTGLALLFKGEAESAKSEGDAEDEKYFYAEAAKSFEKAIAQLSATEPVVYLFLGKIYEDIGEKKKAIAVYEKFLRDMPENSERSAVESFIFQLKKPSVVQ